MGQEFNNMILQKVADFKTRTNRLKEQSDYYPKVLILPEQSEIERGHSFVATTLVRKEWNGKWYTIHHVQRVWMEDEDKERAEEKAKSYLLMRMMYEVHNCQNLYIVTGKYEDEDKSQQSESERLKSILKF